MQLSDQHIIPLPPAEVYAALNDVAVLKQCIPGCDSLEKKGDNELTAQITLKIGPVKATFKGDVVLSNLNPPHGYTISGQGSGGAAGFAKGSADVALAEKDGGTQLTYKVDVQVSGKIAQLGSRLIDSTAKKLAKQFFEKLVACLSPPTSEATAVTDTQATAVNTPSGDGSGNSSGNIKPVLIVAAIIAVIIAVSATKG